VFFLSLIGIPTLSGFIGKFTVFSAAVSAGQPGLALVGVLTGVISVGYYLRVLREAFFRGEDTGGPTIPVTPALRFIIVTSLVMTFVIGLYPGPFLDMARQAAQAIAPLAAPVAGAMPGS
jgi:NADH-quinone oxidoreductase subunit N